MGRYYTGDIEGKFWFGAQSSDDADFFGSKGEPPSYLYYYFDDSHLPDIRKGIKVCEKELGKLKEGLDKFFKENDMYNDEMLEKELGINGETANEIIEWYARLLLGKQILDCVVKTGTCEFEAEL